MEGHRPNKDNNVVCSLLIEGWPVGLWVKGSGQQSWSIGALGSSDSQWPKTSKFYLKSNIFISSSENTIKLNKLLPGFVDATHTFSTILVFLQLTFRLQKRRLYNSLGAPRVGPSPWQSAHCSSAKQNSHCWICLSWVHQYRMAPK